MMEDCCSDKYTFTDEGSEVKITIDDLSVYTGFQYWLDTTDEYDEIKALEGEARLLKFKEYYQSQVDAKKFTQLTTEIIRLPAFEDFTPTLNCASFTESEGKLKIDDIIYYTAYQSWVDMERPDLNEEVGEFDSFKSWLLGQQELKKISQTTTDIKHLPTTDCVGGPKGPVETLDFAPIDQDETTQVNATYMSDGVFRVLADNVSEVNSIINLRDWTSKPPKKLNLPSINDEENKSGLYIKNKIPEFLCVRVNYNLRKYLILATAKEQNDGLFNISTEGNAVTTLNCIALDITEYEPSVDATSVYLQYKEIYDTKSEYYIQDIEVKQGNPFYHCDFEDKTYRFNMSPYELPNLYGAEWIDTPGLYVNKETYSTSRWRWKHGEDDVKFNFYLTKKNDETKITHIKNSELTEYTLPNDLGDGDYTLTIESVDSRGNISDQSLTSTFTIDTALPRIDSVSVESEKTNDGKYKITWSWSGTGDKYNVKLGDDGTYSSRENNSFTSIATVISDTIFKLFVNAEDNAGNKSSSTIKSIKIDVTPPNKPIPTSDTPTNNLRPNWTWDDVSDEDTITYQISINGIVVVDTTTSTEYQPENDLEPNKSYKISVRAKDEAGNLSEPGEHTVVIDTNLPEVPNIESDKEFTNQKTIKWTWNAIDGAVKYLIKINEQSKDPVSTEEYTLSDLEDGTYTISVASEDSAGNISNYETNTVVVDTTPPSKPSPSTTSPTNNSKPTWIWTDVTGAEEYEVTLSSDNNNTKHNVKSPEFTTESDLSQGEHIIYVIAIDKAGNRSEAGTHTVDIDTTAPSKVELKPDFTTGTAPNTQDTQPKFTWTGYTEEIDYYTVNLTQNDQSLEGYPKNVKDRYYSVSSDLPDGTYTIIVTATDKSGNIGEEYSYTFTIDTTYDETPNPTTTSPTDTLTPTFTWSDYVGNTGETYKFGVRFGKAVTNFEDLTETITTEKSFTPSANIEVGITYKIYVCSIDKAGNKSEYGQFDVIKNADDPIINTEYEIASTSIDFEVSSNFNELVTHGSGFNGDYYTWNSATSSFEYKQEVPLDTSTTEQNVYRTYDYGKVRRSRLFARYFPMFVKDTLIYVEQSSDSSIGPSYYCTVGRWPGQGLYGTGSKCSNTKTLRYTQSGRYVEYSLFDMYYFQANVDYSGYRILKSNGDTLSKDDNWKTSFPTTTWNESSTFSSEHNVLICTEFVKTYDQQYNAPASKNGIKVYPYIPSSLTNAYKRTDVHYGASNFYWRECNGNYVSAGGNPGSVRIRNHSSSFAQNPFNNAYGLCFYHLEDGKWVKKKNVTYSPDVASQNAFPKFLQKYSSFTKDNTIHINAISSDAKSLISAKYTPTTQTYLMVGKTTIDTDLYGKYDSDHVFALSESIILVVVQDKEYKSKIMKIYQVDGSRDSHIELWSFTYTNKTIEDINISEDRTNVCILSKDTEDKYEIGIFTTSDDKQKLNYLENANLQETTRIKINSLHISNNFNSTNDGKSYTNVKRVIYSQSAIKFIDFHNENEIDTSPPSMNINDADTPTNDTEISWSFSVEGHSGDVTGKIKSKPSSSSVSVVTISGNTASITADVEGEYSIELIALNEAGNAVTKTSNSVTYDKTPTNKPNPSTTTPTNNLKPTWSWSGVADAEKYKVTLSSDNDTTHEITNTEFTPSSNLTEGEHTISVIAVDEAGNESEAGTHTVVIEYSDIIIYSIEWTHEDNADKTISIPYGELGDKVTVDWDSPMGTPHITNHTGEIDFRSDGSRIKTTIRKFTGIKEIKVTGTLQSANLRGYADETTDKILHDQDTEEVKNFREMVKKVEVKGMSSITDGTHMFEKLPNCTEIDLTQFDLGNSLVTTLNGFFSECSSLTNVNLTGLDTSNIKIFTAMFRECSSLEYLVPPDHSYTRQDGTVETQANGELRIDTTNSISFNATFSGCTSLKFAGLGTWNTSETKTWNSMFSRCSNLTKVTMDNWDLSNARFMSSMFYECSSLTDEGVGNFTSWKESVTYPPTEAQYEPYTFKLFSAITESPWPLCDIIYTLEWPSGWSSSASKNIKIPISDIDFTKGGLWVDWGEIGGPHSDYRYKHYSDADDLTDGISSDVQYFSGQRKIVVTGFPTGSFLADESTIELANFREMVKKVEVKGMSELTSAKNMFCYLPNCTEIDLTKFNSSKVKSMSWMFTGCTSLTYVDINHLDTSVVDFSDGGFVGMFMGCSSLEYLVPPDHSYTRQDGTVETQANGELRIDTSNTSNFSSFLRDCTSLKFAGLGTFDTTKVHSYTRMFSGCSNLTKVTMDNWNVMRSTNMIYMFENCRKLTDAGIDFTPWRTNVGTYTWPPSNVNTKSEPPTFRVGSPFIESPWANVLDVETDGYIKYTIEWTHGDASQVTTILPIYDFGYGTMIDWNDSRNEGVPDVVFEEGVMEEVDDGQKYYYKFSGKKTITIRGNVQDFYYISGSTSVLIKNFLEMVKKVEIKGMSHITNASDMFMALPNCTEIDLSQWDTSKVVNMSNLFMNCTSLTYVDINHLDTSEVKNFSKMFSGCSSLQYLVPPDHSYTQQDGTVETQANGELRINTSSATNFEDMFFNCPSLKFAGLGTWNTSQVQDFDRMFMSCGALMKLTMDNWNVSNARSMNYMFYLCRALGNSGIDFTSWTNGGVFPNSYIPTKPPTFNLAATFTESPWN